MADIRIGTSAFNAAGWAGSFYPKRMKPAEYLSFYATRFDAVELDNTFYATPALSTVKSWYAKTPPCFLFAAKVPQVITHEKVLVGCDDDLKNFLTAMDGLGEKLGPMLFQFGKFKSSEFKTQAEFLVRLKPFLKTLPKDYRFAVQIRNKDWLDLRFVDLLREHSVALALIDQSWMPRPWELKNDLDLITSDFTYVRWLGDRKGIEEKTKMWDRVIVDRQGDLIEWVGLLKKVHERRIMILAFANHHYAGNGPATVELFRSLWGPEALPKIETGQPIRRQSSLFDRS
jgi:uncharacterized protein YecE (DUF72 family)